MRSPSSGSASANDEGAAALNAGDVDGAVASFARAVALLLADKISWATRRRAGQRRRGTDHELMERVLRKMARLFPDDSQVLVTLGRLLTEQRRFDESRRRSGKLAPGRTVHVNIGTALNFLRQPACFDALPH